jgi:hypothetical protein
MSMSHELASAAAVAFHREGVNTIMKSEIELCLLIEVKRPSMLRRGNSGF